MRIVWTARSLQDIETIADFIAEDDPAAADRLVRRIENQISGLAHNPGLGCRGRVEGTRELVLSKTPYLAAYRIGDGAVEILAIVHGAQRWPSSF
ncbi:type II toxin-antitoxin system RelE/ParE family toxin [Chelatococcus sp. GCM10030263]|uniref:type II toxin-antitoxin system RelE/ParE family toxin n=1 Tax=Chelatococcus sp. GCM10030263 TaxID=3273387 RepID=UPI003616091A